MKQKFYAVKKGRQTGVFDNWNDCELSTKGFPNPDYMSFPTKEEAEAYLQGIDIYDEIIKNAIRAGYIVAFCDGSYDNNKKRYSYGVVVIDNNFQEHEICGTGQNQAYIATHNIIGEIFGVIHALDWAVSNGYEKIIIFHDYEGLSKWVMGEWEAKSDVAKMYVRLYNSKFADVINIKFEKVKGHSNNKYNDRADELAKQALTDNARVPIKGDNWFVVPSFKKDELDRMLDMIQQEYSGIAIVPTERNDRYIYKLNLENCHLTVSLFKNSNKKLLVQGQTTILFQIFITYIYELLGKNAEPILGSAYRKQIDSSKIDVSVKEICPDFPHDYPENIKRLVRQSVINLHYYNTCEDYSQYAFSALRALEGHMKYLFGKVGINITSKKGFNCFNFDKDTGQYVLQLSDMPSSDIKLRLERYYNFYNAERHTIFHFGDIIGNSDSTRIIETKEDADHLIKKCLAYICE